MKPATRSSLVELGNVSAALMLALLLTGCGKSSEESGSSAREQASESDTDDKQATPEQRKYLVAAKPFALAIASRKYDEAYALLSSHATARMSLNQFAPEDNDAKFAETEKNPVRNVTAERFRELMQRAEDRFGAPRTLKMLSVFSTDPKALDRRGKENLDAVDAMFAVGMIPDTVPADIRRASIRGRIVTQLAPQELDKAAKQAGVTVGELQKDPDFEPYFTIKIVVIEQDGQWKVGYFECLPPSMMD